MENRCEKTITLLVSIGLIASWCASILISMEVGTNPDNAFSVPQSKPLLYYLLHGTGIIASLAAGLLAAFNGQYKRLGGVTRIAFWTLQAQA